MTGHVTQPLGDALDPQSFAVVAAWLRDVASEHALEVDDRVLSPSVAWLAEAVTFYEAGVR